MAVVLISPHSGPLLGEQEAIGYVWILERIRFGVERTKKKMNSPTGNESCPLYKLDGGGGHGQPEEFEPTFPLLFLLKKVEDLGRNGSGSGMDKRKLL
jgi:hypothetical protein